LLSPLQDYENEKIPMLFQKKPQSGVTLIELIVAMAILSILAMGILPLSAVSYKRTREIEARRSLRLIRSAIDRYKEAVDEKKIDKNALDSGYPKTLEVLVEGVDLKGPTPTRMKFLRRIPRNPFDENGEWGLRSYADPHDSDVWGEQDVYDVYIDSDEEALDGSVYREW
jgi:general secretion pathway protein G